MKVTITKKVNTGAGFLEVGTTHKLEKSYALKLIAIGKAVKYVPPAKEVKEAARNK